MLIWNLGTLCTSDFYDFRICTHAIDHTLFFSKRVRNAQLQNWTQDLCTIYFLCVARKPFNSRPAAVENEKIGWIETSGFNQKEGAGNISWMFFFSMRPTGAAHSQASMHQRRGLSRRVLCSGVVLRRTNNLLDHGCFHQQNTNLYVGAHAWHLGLTVRQLHL